MSEGWASGEPQFRAEAISEFAAAADGWVAAYAWVHGTIVVTHERHDPNVKKRVPLGNVCHEFRFARQGHLRDAPGAPRALRLGEVVGTLLATVVNTPTSPTLAP